MKQGQTYHEFGCTCDFCKVGDTRHPDTRLRNDDGELMYVSDRDQICQATFKEHCQYPKCDCDRSLGEKYVSRELCLVDLDTKIKGKYVGGMTEYWKRQHECLLTEKGQEIMNVLDGPGQECYPIELSHHVTDPSHGGKVTCHKCNGFIIAAEHVGYLDHQHKDEFPHVHFHKRCFNSYEHYYGLDKPID